MPTSENNSSSSSAPKPTALVDKQLLNFAADFVAGGISGGIAKTVSAPIDRVKLLMQTQAINTAITRPYKSVVDCVVRVYREQGFLSFWRGNLANIYRYFPNQALNFAFKDKYKEFFIGKTFRDKSAHSQESVWIGNLLAGGLAGGTSLFFCYPFDLARTRLATDVGTKTQTGSTRTYRGTFDCLSQTWRRDGVTGVYAGFGVSFVGAVLFKALYFGTYDSLKHSWHLDDRSIPVRFLVAQVVTTVMGTLCYPIDTVKRRLMVQTVQVNPSLLQQQHQVSSRRVYYRSAMDCFTKIIALEGVKGLFSGLSANLLRGFSGAILLVGYDEIKAIMARSHAQL